MIFYFFYKLKQPVRQPAAHDRKRTVALQAPENCSELCFPVLLEMCMKTNYWFNQNRLLSHLRTSFCALAIVGTSLTLPSAQADRPEQHGRVSGNFYPCFHIANVQQAGRNTIYTFSVTATFTGTFTGSAIITERDIIHPDGTITLHGSGIFTDQSGCGTFLFTYSGKGSALDGSESARIVGGQGTGCFAGLHTEGTFQGNLVGPSAQCAVAGAGTYNVQVLFAP